MNIYTHMLNVRVFYIQTEQIDFQQQTDIRIVQSYIHT